VLACKLTMRWSGPWTIVGRTLGANRLLACSACGKRQRGRPLNAIVRHHLRWKGKVITASSPCALESSGSGAVSRFLLSPVHAAQPSWLRLSSKSRCRAQSRAVESSPQCAQSKAHALVRGTLGCSGLRRQMMPNYVLERTVGYHGACRRSCGWLTSRAAWPAAQHGR